MRAADASNLIARAFDRGRMAHAYLLVGAPRGEAGEVAVQVLQRLFCSQPQPPCGSCEACRKVAGHTLPDVVWIQPERKSRVIGIDQVREGLLAPMSQTSFAGGWKAGVLVGADRLNESAANAFLKTLEEPPPSTLFLLLSDTPQALLPTIVSRCQRLDLTAQASSDLPEPWRSAVMDLLSGARTPGPTGAMAAGSRLSGILAGLQERAAADVAGETGSEAEDPEKEVLDARVGARYREYRAALLISMQRWYRDLLVLRAGGPVDVVYYKGKQDVLVSRSRKLSLAQALGNVQGIEDMSRQLERHLSEATVFAYWLDRLADGV